MNIAILFLRKGQCKLMIDFKSALQKFKTDDYEKNKAMYHSLGKSQTPHTLFIGCSDSRVSPERLICTEPGEIFHIRNIANIVPPVGQSVKYASTTSAVEYAVNVLGVKHIVVCGHSNCGGCDACLNPPANIDQLPYTKIWISQLEPLRERVMNEIPASEPEARSLLLEELNVVTQLQNLLTFDSVRERVENGDLELHGWHYRIGTGEVAVYDKDKRIFEIVNSLQA